jgi:carbon monoxide dehydrogenase subunit G
MEMNGEYRIPAPQTTVWEGLNDPEVLKASIPGCETIEKVSDTELTATVAVKIGPVKIRFKGKVTLSELDPPNSYRISGEGQGGPAGFGKGGAEVTLSTEDGVTVLRYTAKAQVGGKLAQIGARLIDGAAKKLANEFFSNFAEILTPDGADNNSTAGTAESGPGTGNSAVQAEGLAPGTWSSFLVAVVLVVLTAFAQL